MPSVVLTKTPNPSPKNQFKNKQQPNTKILLKNANSKQLINNTQKQVPNGSVKSNLLKEQINKNRLQKQISQIRTDSLKQLDAEQDLQHQKPKDVDVGVPSQKKLQQFSETITNQGKPVLHRTIVFKESTEVLKHDNNELKLKYKPINNIQKLNEMKAMVNSKKETEVVDDNILPVPKKVLFAPEKLRSLMGWKSVSKVGSGLRNLGNTCFMNSVLQCLTYSAPLANFMRSHEHSKNCSSTGFCIFCSLENHIIKSLDSSGKVIMPKEIAMNIKKIAPTFRLGRQEDSHEFIRFVIEGLQKVCLSQYPKGSIPHRDTMTTVVGSIFGGYLRSQVKCTVCNYESNTFDPFMDLCVDINHADSLQKGLAHFVKSEILDHSNKYKCSKCKKLVKATKQLKIHIAPPILTIQLKRFSFMGMFGGKINKSINFEPQLNLSPFMTQSTSDAVYDLYGVLTHLGGSTNSGHYFCFVKNSNGVWHKLDDEFVSQVSLDNVLSQKAYILFYSKRVSPQQLSSSSTITNTQNIKNENGKRKLDDTDIKNIIINGLDQIQQQQPKLKQLKSDSDKTVENSPKILNGKNTASPKLNGNSDNQKSVEVSTPSPKQNGKSKETSPKLNGTSPSPSVEVNGKSKQPSPKLNGTTSTAETNGKSKETSPKVLNGKNTPSPIVKSKESPSTTTKSNGVVSVQQPPKLSLNNNNSSESDSDSDDEPKKVKEVVKESKLTKTWEEVRKLDDKQLKEFELQKIKAKKVVDALSKKKSKGGNNTSQFQFTVGKWDNVDSESLKAQKELLKDEDLKELEHTKDSWNEEFDRGRVKKIKVKAPLDPNEPNRFEHTFSKKKQQKELEAKHGRDFVQQNNQHYNNYSNNNNNNNNSFAKKFKKK
ncbi:peptidase C19 family protein [Tieghemostelium lacteum]|uniref:Ubiquitin carboxyl-terminal hydrolase n=1 Tax=Tieghemostelium lacteum TaxID=361077 RepID=A0A151ZE56_TIELA|nr:peptidase C19 family protein [Tieghemostelium lacteum]|eukprot:KYQ92242.1 peptidase C19 family protein [Tieghemostelium lacteum]